MLKKLLGLFVLLSFVTQTFAERGTHPIFSRLTFPDLFGAMALVIGFIIILRGYKTANTHTKIYTSAFFLIFCFFLPVLFSKSPFSTFIECLILLFLVLLSIVLFEVFKDDFLETFIPKIIYISIIASFVGVYDYFAGITGLPRLFPSRASGEVLSGFKNAGQAGAYFLVIIAILHPLRYSKLYEKLTAKNKSLLKISLICAVIFLGLTAKIAAYIGLLVGFIGYAIIKRSKRSLVSIIVVSIVVGTLYINLEHIAPLVYRRITYKYETRIEGNLEAGVEDNFIMRNINDAVAAFKDRPLIGSGIGAFNPYYSDHEVHSTYFKMVGETGLLGMIGYAIFLYSFLDLFKTASFKKENPFADFLRLGFPFILGCLVSWSYTYHLRKREFWLLVTLLIIIKYQAHKWEMGQNVIEQEGD